MRVDNLARRGKRGALLLIFLFTAGVLGLILTGLYTLTSNATLLQSSMGAEATKRALTRNIEQIHKSSLDALSKDYINNATTPTLTTFDSTAYQTALANATNWALNTTMLKEAGVANPGGLSVTMPDTVTYPPFSKSNPTASGGDFVEHPLSWANGRSAEIALSANYTPTWTDKTFAYSRRFVFYREIPAVYLPLSVAYSVSALSRLDSVTMTGGPAVYLGGHTASGYLSVGSTLSSTPKGYSNLVSSYGVDAKTITEYDVSSTGLAIRQKYSRDPNVIILNFDGSAITVNSAPVGGTTVPAAITTTTWDGRTRVRIDLSTLPTTGNYTYRKWYINCTTAAAKAQGVVLDGVGLTPVSIATNGMLNLWQLSASASEAIVAATSYGAVGFSDSDYNGTTVSAALDSDVYAHISAYTQATTRISDNFGRTAALASSTPAPTSGSVTWGSAGGAGSLSTAAGSLTATAPSAYCHLPITSTMQNSGVQGYYATADFGTSVGSSRSLTLTLAQGDPYDVNNHLDLSVTVNSSDAMTVQFTHTSGGSLVSADTGSASPSYSAGAKVIGLIYSPGSQEIFATINGSLVLKRKLSTVPSSLPTQLVLNMTPNVTTSNISQISNPLGTLVTSTQAYNGGVCALNIYGGLATGEGIASALYPGSTLNIQADNTVSGVLENLCERIIINYPYFYKP